MCSPESHITLGSPSVTCRVGRVRADPTASEFTAEDAGHAGGKGTGSGQLAAHSGKAATPNSRRSQDPTQKSETPEAPDRMRTGVLTVRPGGEACSPRSRNKADG